MNRSRGRSVWGVLAVSLVLAVACDDTRGSADGSVPDAGVRGDAGPMPDGGPGGDAGRGADAGGGSTDLFVPDIPMTYDGMIVRPGIEVLAFTIYEALLGPTFLVAMRNVSADLRLCSLDLTVRFDDASGTEFAISQGPVETPPHRGVSGTGRLTNCLSPGQVGMQAARIDIAAGFALEDIAAGRWRTGAINLVDAVPTTDIDVTGVTSVPGDFGGNRFVGQLNNRSSRSFQNPSVSVFGVNAVGRPTVEGSDIELLTIRAGGSWSFQTLAFQDEVFVDVVAFPEAGEP